VAEADRSSVHVHVGVVEAEKLHVRKRNLEKTN
jgi:hypothetical protein